MVLRLDAKRNPDLLGSSNDLPQISGSLPHRARSHHDSDHQLNNTLRYAIYAYAARWLPLRSAFRKTSGHDISEGQNHEQEVRNFFWNQAKQALFPALTRSSYRSILALLLFTIAEMPAEEGDAGFLQLCNQALFGHLSTLRAPMTWRVRQPPCTMSSNSPLAEPSQTNAIVYGQTEQYNDEDKHERDDLFWLCVISGCSRGLLQQLPSLILPTNSGNEKVWSSIRKRTEIFNQSFGTLKGSQDPLPSGVAEVVLQHATACKTMYFGVINQLCDSLFYHKLLPVQDTAQAVLDESHRFHEVFDHLLNMCSRDYIYLSTESRLNYRRLNPSLPILKVADKAVLLMCHYHLGTLVLADILDTLDVVPELLQNSTLSRSRACQAIINTLSLSLNFDRHSDDQSSYGSKLLLDPAPELMAEVLLRTGSAVLLMHKSGEVASYPAQTMLSIIFSALNVLSEISRKASFVLSIFRAECLVRNLKVIHEPLGETLRASTTDLAVLATCSSDVIQNFLQEMQVHVALDSSHLADMINSHGQKLRLKVGTPEQYG
jgi:hypothetical protein